MIREELIQSPYYWKEMYNNECWRLGVEPNRVGFLNIDIESDDDINKQAVECCMTNFPEHETADAESMRLGFLYGATKQHTKIKIWLTELLNEIKTDIHNESHNVITEDNIQVVIDEFDKLLNNQ